MFNGLIIDPAFCIVQIDGVHPARCRLMKDGAYRAGCDSCITDFHAIKELREPLLNRIFIIVQKGHQVVA